MYHLPDHKITGIAVARVSWHTGFAVALARIVGVLAELLCTPTVAPVRAAHIQRAVEAVRPNATFGLGIAV